MFLPGTSMKPCCSPPTASAAIASRKLTTSRGDGGCATSSAPACGWWKPGPADSSIPATWCLGRCCPSAPGAGWPIASAAHVTCLSSSRRRHFTKDTGIKAHADHKAAKGGDEDAAIRLVTDLIKPENIEAAATRFGPEAIYLPVIAEEASGNNASPEALAQLYANATGAASADDIVQISRAFHTGARPMERLISRPAFDGDVVKGGRYVLVDDVSVMGGTLAELAHYVQENGGEVVGVVTLVNASRGGVCAASPKQVRQIEERYGDTVREGFGIDPSALTADEAAYILNFRDADQLRSSVVKAKGERAQRLLSRGIRPSEAGEQGQELEDLSLASFVGGIGAEQLAAAGRPAAKEAIAIAEQLEKDGASRDLIWSATADILAERDPSLIGVYRGIDGRWRVEIDDAELKVRLARASRIGPSFSGHPHSSQPC